MKAYKMNVGHIGSNQFLYLVKLRKSEHGYDYLLISWENIEFSVSFGSYGEKYRVGQIIKDIKDIYVTPVEDFDFSKSMHNNFLLTFFLENYPVLNPFLDE